ncbi:hypothetical protein IB286_05775 [Spongiibacter sp. KMU-158]|uniref:Uncharacterized protein n=1 Tax=Spongiibacter pelagi TaxID=2760804 RepID=A0A927GVW4_9GAMM|nr:hypothetical protein [Spongiibacter pelagi]MBD2858513.1 hypothetical protein [Spongiibacter pelagi]
MNPEDVKFAWQIYLAVGGVAVLLWALLIWKLKVTGLKVLLILMAVAFLFTPVAHPDVEGLLVPGSVAMVMHWMSHGLKETVPILLVMGFAQIGAIVLSLVFVLLRHQWLKRQPEVSATANN